MYAMMGLRGGKQMSFEQMPLMKRVSAEFLGTFWLVFGGCGAAVLAAGFPQLGIGFAGVALAFGLTVMTMAFAIGHISGCHLNPAVTIGLAVAKRFPWSNVLAYIAVQVLGAIVASGVLYAIASGKPGFSPGGFAPIAIGLGLTLIHLIGIPVTNLSVNPARSTGPAVVVGGWALQQLWLFWIVPIIGASIAGLAYPWLAAEETQRNRAASA